MAKISTAAQTFDITQSGGYGTAASLNPHMEKATIATGKVLRVIPSYACDTWEIMLTVASGSPTVRIFGLDDDYDGSGAPAASEKYEVPDTTPEYDSGFASADLPRSIIGDQAWKALQFDVSTSGSALIKVKAYRSGRCTFEGSFAAGTQEDA